jgi:hypothetical protein
MEVLLSLIASKRSLRTSSFSVSVACRGCETATRVAVGRMAK